MFQALVSLLILLTAIMIISVGIAHKKAVQNRKHVIHLIWTAVFTAVCYTAFLLIPPKYYRLAMLMDGLYFLATDWLVVYLMLFAASYTQLMPPSKLPRIIVGFLAGVDSISFVINTFTEHMFSLELMTSEEMGGLTYWYVNLNAPHAIHRIFVYGIVLYSLFIFFYRFIKAPTIYKNKYGSVLIQVLAVVGLNILCSILGAKYDYSVILYASLAISTCYFTLYAAPKKLLESIHTTIVDDSVIGLFAYDSDGMCVGVNPVAEELFAGEDEIFSIAEQYLAKWQEDNQGNTANLIGADQMILKDGEEVYLHVNYQKFLDKKKRVQGSCFQFENRTEVVKQFKEEQYRANHDTLTGLLNRSAFEEECVKILAQAKEPYCMICTNIQDFKLVNELYGSELGDKLLLSQTEMIRKAALENSASARIYADKFCSLLPRRLFREDLIVQEMSEVVNLEISSFKLHYHIGVYNIEDVNEPVWTMYDKASMAIDSIKGDYEQSIAYYEDRMLERIMQEKEVLSEFDQAIAERQFNMFLQPQIANDGTVVGAEALVRWIHPEKGMISPGIFIPTLEKAGLIHKLDLYMWENAASQLEEWKKMGKTDFSISVNISTKDFLYLDICDVFRSLSEQYDFDIKNLKLEITESALMENVKENMKTLDGLHALGYDIEIDDFGSGYSSLGMLKDINADILKIDMIFLQETKNVERSLKIIKNIIAMSKELGMPVITEGVETKEQVDFLKDVGCDMFQGFYFAKPMSLDNFEREYCKAS